MSTGMRSGCERAASCSISSTMLRMVLSEKVDVAAVSRRASDE